MEIVTVGGDTPAGPAGLDHDEAARRLLSDGPNLLPRPPRPTTFQLVGRQVSEPLTLVLVVVAGITLGVLRQVPEGAAIAAIVVLNAGIGVSQERRAQAAIDALETLAAPTAKVHRAGQMLTIPAAEVVRGDLVELAAGDRVPADVSLVEAVSMAIDEAILTGESLPAEKRVGVSVRPGSVLADRLGDAFAGTVVVRGRGLGVVTAAGARTEIGAIASGLGSETAPPLVRELGEVARRMSAIAVSLGAVFTVVVLLRHRSTTEALVAGVALAVAAVPEGLATVVTSALALGARRMAKRGAIVRRLPAIEALGAATVICTDKTGTLTTGSLEVAEVVSVPGRDDALWDAAARCNDARDGTGDPMDVALEAAAGARGHLRPGEPRLSERPFDATTRLMATVHQTDGGPVLSVKGAPEVVLGRCPPGDARHDLEMAVGVLARQGLRVLALATARTEDADATGLEPLGLIAFHDPLRPSTVAAVAQCRRAGIRVKMVTGDQVATARAVAVDAGLDPEPVVTGGELAALPPDERASALLAAAIVARVDPSSKVDLVAAHRAAGDVVAMTGDGVNDAPALRQADIGVAVSGESGTDVAREAAGIVVTNGDLATLVAAISEGRRIWRNLVSVVSYLLTGNVSELLVVTGSLVLLPDLAIPLLPVQLLWVNFVTDGLPAVALGVDNPPGDPLAGPPRSTSERLLSWQRQVTLLGRAVIVAALVLGSGVLAARWGWSDEEVRTQLLLSLLGAHLVLAYVSRTQTVTFSAGWSRNRVLLGAVAGSLLLQVPAFATGPGRDVLGLAPLPFSGWIVAGVAAVGVIPIIDLWRVAGSRRRPARASCP